MILYTLFILSAVVASGFAWKGAFNRAAVSVGLGLSLGTMAPSHPALADGGGGELDGVFNQIQKVQQNEKAAFETPFSKLKPIAQKRLALKVCEDKSALKVCINECVYVCMCVCVCVCVQMCMCAIIYIT